MKRLVAVLSLVAAIFPALGADTFPHVDLTNGPLRVMVYLPDAQNGLYRSGARPSVDL